MPSALIPLNRQTVALRGHLSLPLAWRGKTNERPPSAELAAATEPEPRDFGGAGAPWVAA
jgi:hypothetical protein